MKVRHVCQLAFVFATTVELAASCSTPGSPTGDQAKGRSSTMGATESTDMTGPGGGGGEGGGAVRAAGTTTGDATTGGAAGAMTGGAAGASVEAGTPPSCLQVTDQGESVAFSNCILSITISKKTGLADYAWNGTTRLRGASAGARLATELKIQEASMHTVLIEQVAPLQDAIGTGKVLTVAHAFAGMPTLRQSYYLYDKTPFGFVELAIESPTRISSNRMSVLAIDATGAVDIGGATDPRILVVPFHNDEFTRYDARSVNSTGESYEVAAVYDNAGRGGLIVGSATHDAWKSAISYSGAGGKIQTLDAYAGASSAATQDTQPHGALSGTSVRSSRMFVGYFSDWRDGLESFGKANASLAPNANPWTGGVIFGFNTWSAYQCAPNEALYEKASDFVAKSLMPRGFKGTTSVFMNWDACGMPSAASVGYVKTNGQKAGVYLTPFTSWGDGSDPRILHDDMGNPLPKIDNGYPLDPTHPDVKSSVLSSLARFKGMGYEYIKLDFMTHGIREGAHYDKSISTGVAAYNYGLKYIADALAGSMFVDLSIAPIFPGGQYVHARRVSCDAFGGLFNSEYLMNSAGYGWWLSSGVYQYNDPDHVVVATSAADSNQLHTVNEARTRVNASAIAGTVFLVSDKLDSDTEAQSRAAMLLTNADVNAIARRGKAFRPVEGNTGTKATSLFVSNDGAKFYLAVFNWSNTAAAKLDVDLARGGLDPTLTYAVRDLWSGAQSSAKGTLTANLDKALSTIFELAPAP